MVKVDTPLEKTKKDLFSTKVPKCVFLLIASHLKTPQDLGRLSSSCKRFHFWIKKENQPWKNVAHNLFPSNFTLDNIKDHKQFIKNQIYLFNHLPDNIDDCKNARKKLKDIPEGTENNLCPSELQLTSSKYTRVWQENDEKNEGNRISLLCKPEADRLLFTVLDPQKTCPSAPEEIKMPLKKHWMESKIVCAAVTGKVLFLGINCKTKKAGNNATVIPTGVVVLINKENKSLITTISKESRFVKELQFSDKTSKLYVRFADAKTWYCYDLNKAIKKSK